MKTKIGQVSSEERDEIQKLFERRNGLTELAKVISADNNELYEKIVIDIGQTSAKFQNWWREKSEKYGWLSVDGSNWEIDFQTCDIYLVN